MKRMNPKLPWSLIVQKLRKTLTQQEEINFNSWLCLENNRELFKQIEIVWENIQSKASNYEPDLEFYWKELSARIENDDTAFTTSDKSLGKFISIKKLYRIVAAASVLLAITLSGAYYLGTTNSFKQNFSQTYSSLTGKSKVILPDGTEVWLHSNSTLTYNSNFKSDTREVSMNGEAYFSVTHDAKKPFIVHSNGVSVEVHGTKFNVNSNSSSDNVIVSLVEGSVSMKAANKDALLKPGEEGIYNSSNNTLDVSTGDVEFAKSWADNQLRFENKNLRYVCHYLSKWYSVNIYVDPKISNEQSYTFTLRNENLEQIVRIMSRINSIHYRFDKNNNLILSSSI